MVTHPAINSALGAYPNSENELMNVVRNKTTDPIKAIVRFVLGESLSSSNIFLIKSFIVYS